MNWRSCWLRLRRHRWRWTGEMYMSYWGGLRELRECENCSAYAWTPVHHKHKGETL